MQFGQDAAKLEAMYLCYWFVPFVHYK